MLPKNTKFSNFSRALHSHSTCFRLDNEAQIAPLMKKLATGGFLARGAGLSYSDCCLNNKGVIIDTSRLNHLLSFDESTGLLVCQSSVCFADLFLIHPDFIPPVIPGTLAATLAGGIANDIHGKNNHQQGSFGEHVQWLELQLGEDTYHCSKETNAELFFATIGGLGLTGLIKRVAIKMRQASQFVEARSEKYFNWNALLERMQDKGVEYDYQVAWLDLLNGPKALLSLANHCEKTNLSRQGQYKVPKLPVRFINPWIMKLFNRLYFKVHSEKKRILYLSHFNNPLDSIKNWNHLYGRNGLLQFQALFYKDLAPDALERLIEIIRNCQATPTLAVLKYFTQSGTGLLSFAEPGFTLAIDFINNKQAKKAILAMNEWITEKEGKIYLAKDILLNKEQFNRQYSKHEDFKNVVKRYQTKIRSDLSLRLGISND
ncbi:MAG: FAD-binding oxidoreductase [Tatlockia sp.]|nr:FAD-binding oxidoreductase [Tatlockia sp.]